MTNLIIGQSACACLGYFLLISIAIGRSGPPEIQPESFNILPKEYRVSFLLEHSSPSVLNISKEILVEDLIPDFLKMANDSDSANPRLSGLGWVLLFLTQTEYNSEEIESACETVVFKMLGAEKGRNEAYDIWMHLRGEESAKLLLQGLKDRSDYVKISVARRCTGSA